MMSEHPPDTAPQALAISNALSRCHREYFGRGPETVRTVIQRGYVITFLEGIYTALEKSLINTGRIEIVTESRHAYQHFRQEEFRAVIEAITGRKVRAYLSQNHISPDMAVEIFVLEPKNNEPADVIDLPLPPAA